PAVGREVDDRGKLHPGRHAARCEAEATVSEILREKSENRGAAACLILANHELASAGEKVRHLVPQAKLGIVGIGKLSAFDLADRLGAGEFEIELRDALRQRPVYRLGAD